jgi:hypothetical protein
MGKKTVNKVYFWNYMFILAYLKSFEDLLERKEKFFENINFVGIKLFI